MANSFIEFIRVRICCFFIYLFIFFLKLFWELSLNIKFLSCKDGAFKYILVSKLASLQSVNYFPRFFISVFMGKNIIK